jgi:DNA repair exonuclease SbcCD ATPase subunit
MSPNGTEARWRLAGVTIRQFRGVAKERTYAFDARPALLHGNNGMGKSTVAVALQWILFGRFHGDVLPNSKLDSFLAPVQGKGKSYSGEVAFVRGSERLVISRDGAAKSFAIQLGKESWRDEQAETKRDEILGLDMDTFVRAVLLQQSRIRGLLLDEPKERNKALDRLLGMDAAEHFLELIRPKDFSHAAIAWRDAIRDEQQQLRSQEELLGKQLEEAQRTARDLKFLNKDLNATGLEARYAELSRDLLALGRKYKVEVEPLPPCTSIAQAGAVARAFEKGVKVIRLGAELRKRLTPVQKTIAELSGLTERSAEALEARSGALQTLESFVKKHGDRKALIAERAEAQERVRALRQELKEAEGLRQLLLDAHDYVKRAKPRECPVCERVLPDRADLAARLRERSEGSASDTMEKVRRNVEKTEGRVEAIASELEELTGLENDSETARKSLEKVREKAAEALEAAVAENKLQARLEEALGAAQVEEKKLAQAVEAMEADLEAIDGRERQIRAVLLLVVQKRDELAAHEEKMQAAKKRHEKTESRAAAMERIGAQVEAIRKALIAAKEDLANELLGKAAPRAQELYRRLVRQPVFDTLAIEANAKAAKVDYTFQVTAGPGGPSRDARLVLSDGQLTATALALFFGLAESTQHALDLLYVDDPTQNLDLPCKEAMAKVIAEIARRRQVVVSTQDEDFVTYLKAEGFPKNAIVHHITAWDGNPTVETSTPPPA